MTHFLRFLDESAWTSAATEAGFLIDDTLTAYTHGHAIDVVGYPHADHLTRQSNVSKNHGFSNK